MSFYYRPALNLCPIILSKIPNTFILKTILAFLFAALLYNNQVIGQDLYFPPKTGNEWSTIDPASLGWDISRIDELKTFLTDTHTKAFMVLKDGKIVMEYYFNDHDASKPWYWASAGKSLTSALVAFAEADGTIDLNKASSTYLGQGWTTCTAEEEAKITVKHHITMTTGLDEGVSFDCTEPACLKYKAEPGTRWSYHNAPYTLIDGIIEGATGQNLNVYFKNKLGDKIGMTGLFVKSDYNNVFYSTPRNMARYGLFVLANGKWNGTQILNNLPYLQAMSKSSQNLNPSYGYLWWLNGKDKFMLPSTQLVFNGPIIPTAPNNLFAALGKNDQKLYIIPDEKLLVIRMGDAALDDNNPVPIVFDVALWERLTKIMKLTSTTTESTEAKRVAWFYNNTILISNDITVKDLQITDVSGRQIHTSQNVNEIDASSFPSGTYFVKVTTTTGQHFLNTVFVY